MASKLKYVAAGFLEDAERLLNEFESKNSLEFSEFASVFRRQHFSLIFMGRPDDIELTEFTNEIFRITTHFLSASFSYQVGSIFLLYALYGCQISEPPIKIRIDPCKWDILRSVRQEAIEKKYRSLHYVLDYLIYNSFIFVKNQTLKGPNTSPVQNISINSEKISNFNASYKCELAEYSASSKLSELHELEKQYADIKKSLDCDVKLNKSATTGVYKKIMEDIDSLLNYKTKPVRKSRTDHIGNRRAELKAASFSKNCYRLPGATAASDDSDSFPEFEDKADSDYAPNKTKGETSKRHKRLPSHKRRVGRPRKLCIQDLASDVEEDPVDNIDITNLLQQQQDFFLPPERTEKGKHNRTVRFPLYKGSPKHCDDSS